MSADSMDDDDSFPMDDDGSFPMDDDGSFPMDDDGSFPMDDDVRAFVDTVLRFFDADAAEADAPEQRRRYLELCRAFDAETPPDLSISDRSVPGCGGDIPVRLFRPDRQDAQPCLIYFHGGGWVVGDLDSHHGVCAEVASRAGVTVIAVDYRLAPEHPCPAAHEDSWDVVLDVAGRPDDYGVDAARIAVGGDSAGANIAAGLAIRARDLGQPTLRAQVLVYGAFGGDFDQPSYIENADAPLLTARDMAIYHRLYCGSDALPDDPVFSPLKAERFSGLPPAFVQGAGLDPLRDDSRAFARRLAEAGVAVEIAEETGLPHGFLRARHTTDRGRAAFAKLCDAVRRLLDAV